jgi:hypothetical protein
LQQQRQELAELGARLARERQGIGSGRAIPASERSDAPAPVEMQKEEVAPPRQ